MGAAVSRDHAKLPFGYTHARKDHSFNTSSVSRKRLAPRLLRTSDTTSVTPFPIQDGNVSTSASAAPAASSAVSSIPETDSLSLQQQSHTYHETTSHHNYGYNHNNNQHSHHSSSPSHDSSNTTTTTITTTTNNSSSLNVEDGSTITSLSSVPDSGTGGGSTSTVAASVSVPESDSAAETATRTSVSAATAPSSQRMKTRSSQQQHRTTATTSNEHTGQTASAPGSSLTCATSTYHPQHLINSDLAHATPNINNANNNDQYEHQKRIQTEQDNDMDVVSALGIADRLSQTSYDFFGSNSNNTAASPPRSSSLSSQSVQLRPHPQMLTKQDAATLFISGSRNLQQQGEYETRMSTRSDFRGHPSYSKRALSYELKGSERGLLQLQEEDEDFMDLWDDNALRLEGAGEVDSILDEDVEHLSPIPFSDLPSLTNIGLCSHGLVKLSSNIRLLASATCVQICCNELSKIPMEIGYLHNLVLLDLSKNSLTSLPETIMYLTKLVDLKLSFNQLESIPAGIGGLTKLAALSLDNNRLESIPSQIGLIKGLINLDLSDNPITVLPAEVGKLQFLRRLKLDRCPLVESFSHSPLHSPPTLLELAARVIVRHDVPVPPMTLPHLKTYLKSANTCTFCDGPYFDASVKRGKMIEKNDMFIPLEYTLCQPHWNTELERIKLLFCKRPITSPPANASSVPQGTIGHINVAKRQSQRPALTARSTSGSTNSTLGSTFDLESSSAASTAAGAASGTSRPRNRKYASEGDRSLSFVGNRLSMLLGPRGGDKRERPTSTYRTASMPVVATSANAGSTSATAGSSRLASLSSSSSSSGVGTPRIQTNGAAIVQEGNGEQPIRPRVRRSVTSGILARAAFKLRRPLSMASAFETASVPVGHLDDLGTSSSATDADAATATN